MSDEIYYLDTSALVKRYVTETGSSIVDDIFNKVYRGLSMLAFSYWNLAEAAVVFDKYEKRLGISAKRVLKDLLREVKTLARLQRIIVIGVSPLILREAVKLVFKHHIYVADALQIVSAVKSNSTRLVTGDKKLASIARAERLETIYLGET